MWNSLKKLLKNSKKYIGIAIIVYAIHLAIEGLIVNLVWYKVIVPVMA